MAPPIRQRYRRSDGRQKVHIKEQRRAGGRALLPVTDGLRMTGISRTAWNDVTAAAEADAPADAVTTPSGISYH